MAGTIAWKLSAGRAHATLKGSRLRPGAHVELFGWANGWSPRINGIEFDVDGEPLRKVSVQVPLAFGTFAEADAWTTARLVRHGLIAKNAKWTPDVQKAATA